MYTLAPQTWAAWQMIPGYIGERCVPYCSPIWIHSVQPLKKGSGHLRLGFNNMLYAQGVQDFTLDLRVLKRAENYLVAELDYGPESIKDRVAVVSHIEFEWLKTFCPQLWCHRPPASCSSAAQLLSRRICPRCLADVTPSRRANAALWSNPRFYFPGRRPRLASTSTRCGAATIAAL